MILKQFVRSKLVDNVAQWKKWWSMRFIIVSAAFAAAVVGYASMPTDWQEAIPDSVRVVLAIGNMITVIGAGVARVLKQDKLDTPPAGRGK